MFLFFPQLFVQCWWALQPFPTRRAPRRGSARLSAASSTRRGAVLGVLLLGSCSVSHPGPAALFSPVGRGRWHRRVPISAMKIAPFGSPQEERGGCGRRSPSATEQGAKQQPKKKKRQKNRLTPLLPSLKLFPLSLRACGGFAEICRATGEKFARFWPRDGEGRVRGAALCRQGKENSWR